MEHEHFSLVPGWQTIVRDDKEAGDSDRVLAIQKASYAVIHNSEFGGVIDTAMGLEEEDDPVDFNVLMSLYGGRLIVALLKFTTPVKMAWDPSTTYRFMNFASRHDGQGGLRCGSTNVRTVCANTQNWAEMSDLKTTGFTIRHTSNFEDRIKEVGQSMAIARGESAKWLRFAEQMALWKVNARQRDTYLKKFLPVSDDDGVTKVTNTMMARAKIREILESPTCIDVDKTGYGLLMASTEWSDHFRGHNSTDSFISRQLLRKEEPKARSARIIRQMAGIKS
jgi:phage/plasmid-like protein (TIGR03299 family)